MIKIYGGTLELIARNSGNERTYPVKYHIHKCPNQHGTKPTPSDRGEHSIFDRLVARPPEHEEWKDAYDSVIFGAMLSPGLELELIRYANPAAWMCGGGESRRRLVARAFVR